VEHEVHQCGLRLAEREDPQIVIPERLLGLDAKSVAVLEEEVFIFLSDLALD
jgi:hypothetical protein